MGDGVSSAHVMRCVRALVMVHRMAFVKLVKFVKHTMNYAMEVSCDAPLAVFSYSKNRNIYSTIYRGKSSL